MDLFPSLEEAFLRAIKDAGVSSEDLTGQGLNLKNTVAATSHQYYMLKFNVGF
jgi:hypothetical protein